MVNEKTYIVGAGSPIIDILVNVEDAFLKQIGAEKGGMVLTDDATIRRTLEQLKSQISKVPGGSAGNTIFGLAELGMPTAFLGKLGRDTDGDLYRDLLVQKGGKSDLFRYSDSIHTGCCLSMITPDSERTMRPSLGAASEFVLDDIDPEDFESARHLHIEGYLLYMPGMVEKLVATAKSKGCTVSIDFASFEVVRNCKQQLIELLPKLDIVFANEEEAAEFCGIGNSPEAMAEEIGKIVPVVAVKLGKDGSIIKSASGIERISACPVAAVDTTGAGDLWQSGFLFGWLNDYSIAEAARFGSIIAAEVVKVIGSKIPDDRWRQIFKNMGIKE
ncbi:MAG: adenosine kinase [Victivallaceae bacterium]|nr:adenosine kinase [Victivallaceae bacterium]MDD4316885.1 adenosine kinase [Victivallaceae bacterium]MDD5662727.1 adenosine kinase [Victivallaceae bacterium]NLK82760.1 adenosine kinase [Lentisphaerota bacterium]